MTKELSNKNAGMLFRNWVLDTRKKRKKEKNPEHPKDLEEFAAVELNLELGRGRA